MSKKKCTTDGPSFKVSKRDMELIDQIVVRAEHLWHQGPRLTLCMDITACHVNGCKLDLPKLLVSPALDFMHDVAGIQRHIYRPTGKLQDCFLPRSARRD